MHLLDRNQSAPQTANSLTETYPVQAPTWVAILQDFGPDAIATEIPPPPFDCSGAFTNAWSRYGAEKFLNYGRLPGNLFMLNWPISGNDYGRDLGRLVKSEAARFEFLQEACWYSQGFAHFIQQELGRRYGLAQQVFPFPGSIKGYWVGEYALGGGGLALSPYYRESRRLQGLVTIQEQDILPIPTGRVAKLPIINGQVRAIAIGNYANDHHYPGVEFPLQPKSIRWGGSVTGTPFTIPYDSLVPISTDGFLVAEKNISVSHIANGATRLQTVVMGIGQAAGMAAALCVESDCQPRDLSVRVLQTALLQDPIAPMAVIPLFNLPPDRNDWLYWQNYYLDHPEDYPIQGNCPSSSGIISQRIDDFSSPKFSGIFHAHGEQNYTLTLTEPVGLNVSVIELVTLRPEIDQKLQSCPTGKPVIVWGQINLSGAWILVEQIQIGLV